MENSTTANRLKQIEKRMERLEKKMDKLLILRVEQVLALL